MTEAESCGGAAPIRDLDDMANLNTDLSFTGGVGGSHLVDVTVTIGAPEVNETAVTDLTLQTRVDGRNGTWQTRGSTVLNRPTSITRDAIGYTPGKSFEVRVNYMRGTAPGSKSGGVTAPADANPPVNSSQQTDLN